MRFGLPLIAFAVLLAGCPEVTDNAPWPVAAAGDDDDATDDDDAADDDDGADDDDSSAEPCDISGIVPTEDPISLSGVIEPIFFEHCIECHIQQKRGELTLSPGSSYDELVGVVNLLGVREGMLRVTPGDPEASYLMHKIIGCTPGDFWWGYEQSGMPPDLPGQIPLTEDKISLIWSWIEQGALDN